MAVFDIAIIGVGGMGSAIAAHAAWRGQRVLGLEQYSLPHTRGSSWGISRILRLGLHEDPIYVPLVQRAVELWRELGLRTGKTYFLEIGSLDIAPPASPIFRGSLTACQQHGIAHETLGAAEIRRRFPGIEPDHDMAAIYQPGSGLVLSDATLIDHQRLALAAGAELHGHEPVLGWDRVGELYSIRTERSNYLARAVVITTGAWARQLLPGVPVQADRQVVGWFQPKEDPELFEPSRMPSWIMDSAELGHFYGLPVVSVPGFKLSRFARGDAIQPGGPIPPPQLAEEEDLRQFLRRYFPKADGALLTLATMFFENTPDRAFIIDHLPGDDRVWLAVGFSGHGYKYASAIGELLTDLVTGCAVHFDLSSFRLARFPSVSAPGNG